MVGPVLFMEMLLGSRRGRQYIFRWIYAGWLILCYGIAALVYLASRSQTDPPFSDGFLRMLLVQHFWLIILATPAFVAGAITDEKTQGTLQYLMCADLTPAEIVLGKFIGRLYQVAVLFLTGLPIICFCGVFGGLDLVKVIMLAGYTFLILFVVGSASILSSVLTRTTREAVLDLYALGGLAIFFYLMARLFIDVDTPILGPFIAFAEYVAGAIYPNDIPDHVWNSAGTEAMFKQFLGALLLWGTFGLICMGLSVTLLRRAYIRQLEGEGKKKVRRWWRAQRTDVTNDPIRWKERQVEGLAPMAALRAIPTWLGMLFVFLLSCTSCCLILRMLVEKEVQEAFFNALMQSNFNKIVELLSQSDPWVLQAFRWQGMAVMLLASLVVAIRCSGSVSGEREKHTWEALLLSPIETRALIRGKLWGIIGASHPYLLAYAVPAILLSILGGPYSLIWTLIWLAVTWLAMYYVGAAGIWCSVRSKSSWRSLLGTLGFCYVGAFVIYGPLAILMAIAALFIMLILVMIDSFLHTQTAAGGAAVFTYYGYAYELGMCLGLAGIFFGLALFFLYDAEKRVGALERTRHWEHDPDERLRYRRPRSRSRTAR